jgi:CheY-like chemotaxis protein
MKEDWNRCLQAGMDDYLAKPVEIANLSRTLNHWAQIAYQSKAVDHHLPQVVPRENVGHSGSEDHATSARR